MIPIRTASPRRLAALGILIALATTPSAWAGVKYKIRVDTAGVQSSTGYIDLQLNPYDPGVTPGMTATVSEFTGQEAFLGLPDPIGGVSGDLPGPVTLANTETTNSYFRSLKFGSSLEFLVNLDGPAFSETAAVDQGTSFLFALYDQDLKPLNQGIYPPATEPSATVVRIDLLPDVTRPGVTPQVLAHAAYLGGDAAQVTQVTAVPEASTLTMGGLIALAGLVAARRGRRRPA